jgi:serine/threonine-protein kinase RsbW
MTSPEPPAAEVISLELAIACDLAEVRQASEAAGGFLERQGADPADVMDCELALVEACNNAIEHAEENARHKPVSLEIRCGPGEIEMLVTDHTPGFDLPEHPALPDLESESGRGLYLIRSIMDSVEYRRGADHNTLVMRRRRRAGDSPPVV